MNKDRLPRVLLTYRTTVNNPVMIPSIRLCGHLQMQALADAGRIEYRESSIDGLARMDLSWPDIVLLGRLDTREECRIAKKLKALGKYLIYILDDDLLNVPAHISSASHYDTPEVKKQISEIIRLSDAILSPSPYILDKYAHAHTRRMLTEEPAVEPVPFQPHEDGVVTIGFAGSVDRVSDLESVLRKTLERISDEYGERVRFSFFGAVPSFAERLNAQTIAYKNSYEEYRRTLNVAGWDIGLAPMMDSPFHYYKHYNKFCEYAAAGIVGVFSRHEPYLRLEKKIGIGCFCENTVEAWYGALKGLIDEPEKREALREQACRYAHDHLTVGHIADQLYAEHAEVFAFRARDCSRPVYMRTIRIRQLYARLIILWQAHGLGIFSHIAKAVMKRVRALSAPKNK